MGLRTRTAAGLIAAIAGLTMIVAPSGSAAAAYVFPSTNDLNRDAGLPHVNFVSNGPGTVTLEFVNDTNSLTFFEYRIDGEILDNTERPAHPVVEGDVIYPGVSVDCRGSGVPCVEERTFFADSTVEVRLALGGERDWDFDWTVFDVGQQPDDPANKDDCKKGGWETFGFANQGQCIRFVNTGKDSR